MEFGYGRRLVEARRHAAVRLGRGVSQAAMAELVSEKLGRPRVLSQSTWSDYEAEKAEPTLEIFRAVARISGLSASYIAFGDTKLVVRDEHDERSHDDEEDIPVLDTRPKRKPARGKRKLP